jgi:hypothetical protein
MAFSFHPFVQDDFGKPVLRKYDRGVAVVFQGGVGAAAQYFSL